MEKGRWPLALVIVLLSLIVTAYVAMAHVVFLYQATITGQAGQLADNSDTWAVPVRLLLMVADPHRLLDNDNGLHAGNDQRLRADGAARQVQFICKRHADDDPQLQQFCRQ